MNRRTVGHWAPILGVLVAATAATGCASPLEERVRRDLLEAVRSRTEAEEQIVELDGSLAAYVTRASKRSPVLRAAYERYRAAVLRSARQRRLPDPTVSYGLFLRSVETRVGPQRQRFSVRQSLPWPTHLVAAADAQSHRAEAASAQLAAEAVTLRRRVTESYWNLWLIRQLDIIERDQDEILGQLAMTVRSRLEVGQANLVDLGQVDLSATRHHDHGEAHRHSARSVAARLLAEVGVRSGPAPTTDAPAAPATPLESAAALKEATRDNPRLLQLARLAQAHLAAARREEAERRPGLSLGVDYIETGEAMAPDVPDSGKDPVIISVAVSLPVWPGGEDDAADAERAEARAQEAEREAAQLMLRASVDALIATLSDSKRRVELHEKTLVPQAETIYEAAVAGYQTGRNTIAEVLLAQRDLVSIRLDMVRLQAAHAIAWTQLEEVVGRTVERREP